MAREQMLGDLTSRMRESLDIDTILRFAVKEIRSALGLEEVEVHLGPNGHRPPTSQR